MNYEQKYNGAIESIKRIYNQADSYGKELMEKEFPELRESEDERIRREIMEYITSYKDSLDDDEYRTWISWLEKQGEKGIIDLKEYAKGILKGAATHLMIWIDENLADGKMCLSNIECKDLEDAMVNAKWDKIYNYIKKKVEKQDEQKSWSEEDEHRLKDTIYFLETAKAHYASMVELDACIAWLKSLKPKKHWKPSEEQMEALKKRTHGLHESSETRKALESLINDLEKL